MVLVFRPSSPSQFLRKKITANVKHFGIISSIMEGGFPFEIKQPRYNKETKAAILEARSISSGEIKARRLAEEI